MGVVQMALGRTVSDNRDRITTGISNAAARGVRVAVFPEGALRGSDSDQLPVVTEAIGTIRAAAQKARLYVLLGGSTWSAGRDRETNWMLVVGPDGQDVFRYEKLYDNHRAPMPAVFEIDGIPCNAVICADRWLRGIEEIPIQQGAQISFELSCNFASEWVPQFGWYWYVPRALRNNVWVVFANTGNRASGVPDDPAAPRELRHGHSAIIAPDGRLIAAARNDVETIVVADVDVSKANRATALARVSHPAMREFWQAGAKLHRGEPVDAPALAPLQCEKTEITLAAAQITNDLAAMESMVREARRKSADLVAFPARAFPATALERLQTAAREHRIIVVAGMEHRVNGCLWNSAFVIGPDGTLLTRYDQLSAGAPFQPGPDPSAMWFRVKGVPAVVTVGDDALWTELAELAAVAGAQIHVHLDADPDSRPEAVERRLQVWSNLASFQTFSATVNVVGSAIWDDLRDLDERRAEVRDLPRPDTGQAEVYSPFSANLVVRAGSTPQLITATRRIGPANRYHPARTSNMNPQMDAWYRLGASLIQPVKPGSP
jgi:predicted amidohydrolase